MNRIGLLAATLSAAAVTAEAASLSLEAVADASVNSNAAGVSIDADSPSVRVAASGPVVQYRGLFAFDTAVIDPSWTLTGARIDFTLTGSLSNTFSAPVSVDIVAFDGDGAVDGADYSATGAQVVNTSAALGSGAGDVLSFAFSSLAPITSATAAGGLTLRLKTEEFGTLRVASIENPAYAPATLVVDYASTAAPVPLPVALPLATLGMAVLGLVGRRAAFRA